MVNKQHNIITVTSYASTVHNLAIEHDLILLDLDDVVLTPTQYLCSSTWYRHYHIGNKHKLSPQQLIHDFYNCLNSTDYKTVSSNLNEDFSSIADVKHVIGLTARSIKFSEETHKQITDLGMVFSDVSQDWHPLIYNGVIYAGYDPKTAKPNNKGDLLQELISLGIFGAVSKVIFLDDSIRNLIEVAEALEANIEFTGIHYTEVKTKLFCEFDTTELGVIEKFQRQTLQEFGYIPQNDDYLEELSVCPAYFDEIEL